MASQYRPPGKEESLSPGSLLHPIFHCQVHPLGRKLPTPLCCHEGLEAATGEARARVQSDQCIGVGAAVSLLSGATCGLLDLKVVQPSRGPGSRTVGTARTVDRPLRPGDKASSQSPGVRWRQTSQ